MAGDLGADAFCTAIEGFAPDRNLPVWQVISAALSCCDRFVDAGVRTCFQQFVRNLAGPALADVGWEPVAGEGDLRGELRGVLIRLMALVGNDDETRRLARDLHEAALVDPTAVDPSIVTASLAVVASTGGQDDYAACRVRYHDATSPQGKLRELHVLPMFPGAEQMADTLRLMLTDDVRTQNAPFAIGRALTNRDHGAQAWKFIRDHWREMNERFPDNTIVRMVDGVKMLTLPEQRADVVAFFGEHDIPQATKTLAQVLERQGINVALRRRASADLSRRFG